MNNGLPVMAARFGPRLDARTDWSRYKDDSVAGEGGAAGQTMQGPFHLVAISESAYRVVNQRLYFGRGVLTAPDSTVTFTKGSYLYVVVDYTPGDEEGDLVMRLVLLDKEDDSLVSFQSKFLLYYMNTDGGLVDFRNTPVIVAMD